MGFLKAYKVAQIEQITAGISKLSGIFWLLAFALFMVSGVMYLTKLNYWYVSAFAAAIISTILIGAVWHDAKFGTIANVIILIAAIVGFGTSSFRNKFEKDVRADIEQTTTFHKSILTEADIENLPEPVKKYISNSGAIGKPKVNNFRLAFTGKIRKDEKSEWMPITAVQYSFIGDDSRCFFLKAKMKGLPAVGYHCYRNGEAKMDIRLFSLIKVQYQAGKEMNISETVTFFNDMCCMAPATLIDNRIKWIETNGNIVRASFTNHNITIFASLFFNDKGELTNFVSSDRYAYDAKEGMIKLPWSTPLKNYREINGINRFTTAEAIYKYPEKDFCYAIFHLTDVDYNFKEMN